MTSRAEVLLEHICDKCVARAQHTITFDSGYDLRFCGHHYTLFKDKLPAQPTGENSGEN